MMSVVVPCYNEERNIPILAQRFKTALRGIDAELILVNNGSTDNSQRVLDSIAKKYGFVRCAVVKRNVGYGHGIQAGLKAARGSVLAFTHADLQCDPADVVKAYRIFEESTGRILVKGNRKGRSSLLTTGFHIAAALLFLRRFDDINGQPKVFHKNLLQTFRKPPHGFQFDFYVQYKALKNGYKVVSFPVQFGARKHGESKWATSLASRIRNIMSFFRYMLRLRILGE
ncbi:MAG: glycosyltransferase family 2 protein [Candidatus Aenigmarchaeota archaeon]|nr:glycosyltransferase family 2 protein [Candidatus Aenigmarchaeota archaeon]